MISLVVLLASLPILAAHAITNLGLVKLLKTPACDPRWFVCRVLPGQYPPIQFTGNRATLIKVEAWFEQAARLQTRSDSLSLHLAEIAFAQGERQQAAQYLDKLSVSNTRQSPLLQEQRYEARLVEARRAAALGLWEAAIRDYRLGLAWGDERTLSDDERDYFLALAKLEIQKAENESQDQQLIYHAGRYLAKAGEWEQAVNWLNQEKIITGLDAPQAAMTLALLGRYHEIKGDRHAAIVDYRRAFSLNPTFRQAGIRLLDLLRLDGQELAAGTVEQQLLMLGPTYYLGAKGEEYLAFQPSVLSNGWTLVGYDLDDEILEQAKTVDLILWWQSDVRIPSSSGWTKVGKYWLQQQVVINLFPNAGFEWGVDERGIPLGHDREIYGAPQGSLQVQEGTRQNQNTNLLVTNNTHEVNHVALASAMMPVDNDQQYLMSGWIKDEWGAATLGRGCKGRNVSAPSPYYVVQYESGLQLSNWVFHAQLSSPQPGFMTEQCEILVMNDSNSERPARFDNILFSRITVP